MEKGNEIITRKEPERERFLQQSRVGESKPTPACERAVLQGMQKTRIGDVWRRRRSHNTTKIGMAPSPLLGEHSDNVPQVSQQKTSTREIGYDESEKE